MTDASPNPPKDFEAALGRLEDIVRSLEDGELGLDNALELFEEGIRLSRFCHGKLEQAERRVELLLKDASGDIGPVPFDAGADSLHEPE
jgi:exodeoxyribonuclease VII small subunit